MTESGPLRLGFIGLGLMGGPMSLRLARAGHSLTVWNRNPEKATEVVAAGAHLAESPSAVAAASDIIFLCLLDTDAVEQVLFGPDGVADGGAPGKIVVDHSTISPTAAQAFATKLHSDNGMALIDAPVTGGKIGATDGTLGIFAGGDPAAAETVRPVVADTSRRFDYLGESGAGQTAKMCNQVMVLNTVTTMAEMVKLAEQGGIRSENLPALFAGGFADSRVLQVFGARMASRDDDVTAQISTMLKDLALIEDVGKSLDVGLPMTGLARQLMQMAIAAGHGDLDGSQIIRLYDQ